MTKFTTLTCTYDFFFILKQLENASKVIRNCSGASDFTATWMVIVKWDKVSPYARFLRRVFFFWFKVFNPYVDEVFYNYTYT